jgi:hypothetical protein
MTCYLCKDEIRNRQRVEYHHPIYKSRGGKQTAPSHARCHRQYHSKTGDFREFGRKGAASGAWAFHLKNVKTHPAYDPIRWSYLMSNGLVGRSAGLVM